MRLSTLRLPGGSVAVRDDGDRLVEIGGHSDVGALLQNPDWRQLAEDADGRTHLRAEADLAPVVPSPGKIVCVGANYRTHILEMGSDLPSFPTLFAKFAEALIGAADPIELPVEDESIDWEAELTIVIGTAGRRIPEEYAASHIAGYTIMNDISMREYQFRTHQWLQGKTWEHSTPLGPALVTTDAFDPADATIRTVVDGETVQESNTADLLFGPAQIVSYISTILTLRPGDVIATGTPAGVGVAREPRRFVRDGSLVETSIDGLGVLRNPATR